MHLVLIPASKALFVSNVRTHHARTTCLREWPCE